MAKIYTLLLDGNKIGTSKLEYGDPPMGVVFGEIDFHEKPLTYDFLSAYCKSNGVKVVEYPEDKLINTETIPKLKAVNENGAEIKGLGCYIEGMDSDGFRVNIIGIPNSIYQQEFPHHIKAYEEKIEN